MTHPPPAPEPKIWDVVIAGAGAAGLFAALTAAERGLNVLLLEKNRRPGVKILMSGGTRCNLTNARGLRSLEPISGTVDPAISPSICQGIRAIQAAFSPEGGRFLGPSLKAFDVDQTLWWFESEGLSTKVEANGKIFPSSDKASDVLEVLIRALNRSGAVLKTGQPVTAADWDDHAETFRITTPTEVFQTRKLVIATGGRSFPGSGTTGDGYGFATSFGHSMIPTRPALVPILVADSWVRELKGVTIPDVNIRVINPQGETIDSRRESLLFSHFGLTGPAILDVSRIPARTESLKGWQLDLDLVPEKKAEQLDQEFITRSRQGRMSVFRILPESLPNRLKEHLMEVAGIASGQIASELSKEKRKALISQIKSLRMPIHGTLGFEKAEVTSGGVCLAEVDPKTLQSRIRTGLYLIGEVLDLDGRIGGYNFQAAWSMGRLAGSTL